MAEQIKPVGVLVKTIQVLRVLASHERPVGPTEIARESGLDRSTVHRILVTLARDRLVDRVDGEGTYHLGVGLARLGLIAASRLDLRRVARPYLERLFARLSETVNLGVLDDDAMLYLDMIESHHGLRMSASVGSRDSPATTSLGKAILAFLPDERREELLVRLTIVPTTPRSIRTTDELRAALAEVRERGYAIDYEENEVGACCIGAPILGADGVALGAISVSLPTARCSAEARAEIVAGVCEAARKIAQEVGGPVAARR